MTDLAPGPTIAARWVRCASARPRRHRVLDALDRLDADTGLPASAILVVRRLDGLVVGEPARLVGTDLRAAARGAHHAGTGSLPPLDADAVVFADRVQVLTCLAEDVAGGRRLGWWWAALFEATPARRRDGARADRTVSLDPDVVVASAFAQLAVAVPAASASAPALIAAAGRRLDAGSLMRLLAVIAEGHAAPALAAAAHGLIGAVAGLSAQDARSRANAATGDTGSGDGQLEPWASWLPWSSNVTPTGGDAHGTIVDAFVGCNVGLWSSPTVARSAAFADAVSRAVEVVFVAPRRRLASIDVAAWPAPAAARADPAVAPAGSRRSDVDGVDARAADPPSTVEEGDGSDAGPTGTIRSRYGGAFYLLVLLDRLDLPASADGDDEPGASLSRWAVLELVLRQFGADTADPLLAALARLDGRDPSDPAAVRSVPSERSAYRLRPAARAWFGPPRAPWRWWTEGTAPRRLVLVDPGIAAGLLVADVPLDVEDDPARVAAAECAAGWPADAAGTSVLAVPVPPAGAPPDSSATGRWAAA
ncbi:MAG: hypothetical protein JWM12_98, partial [Ilumatobacteraceae bacterium]|nr:hypothetical protein [Ilumatobacteraceae bacterium]